MANKIKRDYVVRVPYDMSASEIMAYNPDGVFLSNGPGDPKKCVKTINAIRELSEKVPLMGICLVALQPSVVAGRRHIQTKVRSPCPKPTGS